MAEVKKKKLLMLITNSGMGGAEKVFYSHAASFAESFEVTECYFSLERGRPRTGNRVVELNVPKASGMFGKMRNFFRRVAQVRQLKKSGSFTACVSHMDGANWVNVLSGRKNVRTVTVLHGSLTKDQNRGQGAKRFLLNELIVPYVYRRADAVVCVSDYIKYELERLTGRREGVHSLPNFFEPERIALMAAEPVDPALQAVLDACVPLVHVGRLALEKNQTGLVQILAALQAHHPQAKLFLMGEGPMRSAIIAQAAKNDLRVHTGEGQPLGPGYDVYLLGLMQNPFPVLRQSKVFLLPSLNEGFPLVIVEALLCGVPVLSYDCTSGPRQILAPELTPLEPLTALYRSANGYLLPPQTGNAISPEEIRGWVAALNELLSSPGKREALVRHGRQRAMDFSKEAVLQKWIAVLDRE